MRTLLLAFFALLFSNLNAQDYYFSQWYKGKRACVVLTYDDWLEGHGQIAIPQLIARDMAASFYVNTDWADISGGYTTMNDAIANGIEIGNHTVSHEDLRTIATLDQEMQINDAADSLMANLTDQGGLTFAYPYGGYNSAVINAVKEKHFAARSVWGKWFWNNSWRYNFPTSNNGAIAPYYEVTTYEVTSNFTLTEISTEMRSTESSAGLITFMLHEIYNATVGSPSGYDAIDESSHGDFLDLIKSYEDQFWIATFANSMKYHKENACATLATISNSSGVWKLALTDTLSDNAIYNHPLTVNLTLPAGYEVDAVLQGTDSLDFEIVDGRIVFDGIPDGGELQINYIQTSGTVVANKSDKIKKIYPVPASEKVNVVFALDGMNYQLRIFDGKGSLVYINNDLNYGLSQLQIDVSNFGEGIYHLILSNGNGQESQRIIVDR